ncbi:Ras-related and estrogen-regulated growth inhibitor [Holothuria leucospilota]|uniref:small monomeric GTPase n=1 Tax=Holothuria leucospilota TaxID=206669 RepID=A0A9Q1BTF3_HOLLE|nr:Ras-related and estrogen-regulated growth inhibitor [Holothuria leucospilota]
MNASYSPFPRVRKMPGQGAVRIVVTGLNGVGKSALTVRFLTKRFIGEYGSEEQTKYRHHIKIDGEKILMEILDMGSKNIFQEDTLQWADGIVLVYSITDRQGFEVLLKNKERLEEARASKAVPLAYAVVGNKADLLHQRKVTTAEGQSLADDIGCSFIELSASETPDDVDNVFQELCREIKMYKYRSRSSIFGRMFGTSKEKKTLTL